MDDFNFGDVSFSGGDSGDGASFGGGYSLGDTGFDTSLPSLPSASGQGGPGMWDTLMGGLPGAVKLGGLGLGAGGILASLLGGGGQQTQKVKMGGQQIDALNALRGMINAQSPTAQGLWQQGAGMLAGLGAGQIPAGLTNLVQAAYQPYLQNLGGQAIEASQRAGFQLPQDAMQGGPGLRIMGQGLAQLPGEMAGTTLNTMFPLISALMNPSQQNIGQLQGAFSSIPNAGQVQQQQPSMYQRLMGMGPFLQGIGSIMNPPQQPTFGPQNALGGGQQWNWNG